ncbi:hypothetical protein MCOR25_007439 [Pyricularia grisea]|nr:hypothetical protein MCOR25_007439 [Pyricularia grisea]
MPVPIDVIPSSCAFHPTVPLFLYQSDNSIFLWKFGQVGSISIHFHKLPVWRDIPGYCPPKEASICFSSFWARDLSVTNTTNQQRVKD